MRAGVEQAPLPASLRLAFPRALLPGAHGLSLSSHERPLSTGGGAVGGASAGPVGTRRRLGMRLVTAASVQPDWSEGADEVSPPEAPEPAINASVPPGEWWGPRCLPRPCGAGGQAFTPLDARMACLAGGQAPEETKSWDGEPPQHPAGKVGPPAPPLSTLQADHMLGLACSFPASATLLLLCQRPHLQCGHCCLQMKLRLVLLVARVVTSGGELTAREPVATEPAAGWSEEIPSDRNLLRCLQGCSLFLWLAATAQSSLP